ncbi:hypothetical protein BS78_02G140800 [Paspalum vaginatum]|nr:hypothetical protein BS78_02G140800 [Paspalum vaginatum]
MSVAVTERAVLHLISVPPRLPRCSPVSTTTAMLGVMSRMMTVLGCSRHHTCEMLVARRLNPSLPCIGSLAPATMLLTFCKSPPSISFRSREGAPSLRCAVQINICVRVKALYVGAN